MIQDIIFLKQWYSGDKLVEDLGVQLIVGSVQEAINKGRAVEESGINASRNELQIVTLLDAIESNKIDAAIGGARRDEEKSPRKKERFFSHRDEFGQWDPKNQRPELWNIFNGRKRMGEHFRVFPISNWTEMDVWAYILQENLAIPSLYFFLMSARLCIVMVPGCQTQNTWCCARGRKWKLKLCVSAHWATSPLPVA